MSNCRFSYSPPTSGYHQVGLAGDFSEWQILVMENIGGNYVLNLDIAPGIYAYKFIVDGNWIADPNCTECAEDPFGGVHSLLVVEATIQDKNWDDVLGHNAHRNLESYIKYYRYARDCVELRFSWYPNMIDNITLVLEEAALPMQRVGKNSLYEVFSVCFKPRYKLIRYHLQLQSGVSIYHYSADGIIQQDADIQPIEQDLQSLPLFEIPAWVGESIVYQIFPDRFCNGNPQLNPDFHERYYQDCRTAPPEGELLPSNHEYFHFVHDWKDIAGLKQSPYLPEGKPDWWSFYGGDIAGVLSKLDYLCELGINLLYFNPLWQAKSNHKYDSANFMTIDPHFGSVEDMKSFVHEANKRGIRIILDVAFNHTGETFWAFRDCVQKGSASEYWNWYDWHNWPLPSPLPEDFKPKEFYQCWWGIKDMPDLNYDLSRPHPDENAIRDINAATPNLPLVEHILLVVRWWLLEIGIDGFRLDVPDEVPFWFWELFRHEVKRCKPDAWIVGEIWHNAAQWVNEKYFDAVMNYAYFKNPVTEFYLLRQITQEEFVSKIESGLSVYPNHALAAMMNLLGSHDTLRIFELAEGNITALKQAIIFQMCFPGVPHIYYGDEIAMAGGADPDNRRPFDWDWEERPEAKELRDCYRELIALRKANDVFTMGSFSFAHIQEGLLAFCRTLGERSALIVQNLSTEPMGYSPQSGMQLVYGSKGFNNGVLQGLSSLIFIS